MIENAPVVMNPQTGQPAGCLNELSFHAASFVLPLASLSFYRRVTSRRTGSAALFFILFMAIVSVLGTVNINLNMSLLTAKIRDAFLQGKVPDITIQNGVAIVDASQPVLLINESRTLVAIDATGQMRSIDQGRYEQGFLLTRDELHSLNRGRYQRMPNSQINQLLGQNPLVLDANSASQMWQTFTNIFSLLSFVGLILWHIVLRLMYLAFLAVLLWGGVSIFRKTDYSTVLITGIYAFIPAFLLHNTLGKFEVRFIFLQTLIFIPIWVVGLYGALAPGGLDLLGPDRPLRAWRAWMGLPLMIVLALNTIFNWERGGLINVIALALTGIALVTAGMFTLPSHDEPGAQAPGKAA